MKRLLILTDEEREQIAHRYKHDKDPRFRERLQCLLLKDRGLTNGEVVEMLLVVPETIPQWLNLYADGGVEALCRLETGGSEGFLPPEQIALLQAELDKPVFQTAKQVAAWVHEQFDISYSERGMRDLLRRLGYSHQKAHLVPAQADVEAQAAFLKEYEATKTTRPPTERVLFGDAVHFLHNVHPGCLWAKKGQRPALTANSGRSRYSVLGGYAVSGEYVGVQTDGMVNAQTVICWIDRLEAAFPDVERLTVYVDNARYFHARLVKAHLAGKRVVFVYLPPYTPNLNLIERLWKFCKKTMLVTFYATYAQFTQAIDAFFQVNNADDRELRGSYLPVVYTQIALYGYLDICKTYVLWNKPRLLTSKQTPIEAY